MSIMDDMRARVEMIIDRIKAGEKVDRKDLKLVSSWCAIHKPKAKNGGKRWKSKNRSGGTK